MPASDRYYIKAKDVFQEQSIISEHTVLIEDGMIKEITDAPDPNVKTINAERFSLLPGFIDLHVHGREGCDVMDATQGSIETISNSLAQHGVIGFLATTVTSTWDTTLKAFAAIGEAYHNQPSGAQVLGAYNEGLFFTADHKGAHDEQYFLPLNKEILDTIIKASSGALKVVALAPELDNSDEIIRYLSQKGVKVMLGHTNANYQQTCNALDAGACGGVHVFNGMSGIHHRDPGCAGAVLLDQKAYVEVIADGVHLHPNILQLIYRLKGHDKMTLISDCISAGGNPDGTYKLGMLDVFVKQGIARTGSGSLAGSTLTLEKAVSNISDMANIPLLEAVHMASLVPAQFLGIDKSLGSIKVGKRACLTLVDDKLEVQGTIIDGELRYANQELSTLVRNVFG